MCPSPGQRTQNPECVLRPAQVIVKPIKSKIKTRDSEILKWIPSGIDSRSHVPKMGASCCSARNRKAIRGRDTDGSRVLFLPPREDMRQEQRSISQQTQNSPSNGASTPRPCPPPKPRVKAARGQKGGGKMGGKARLRAKLQSLGGGAGIGVGEAAVGQPKTKPRPKRFKWQVKSAHSTARAAAVRSGGVIRADDESVFVKEVIYSTQATAEP